VGEREGGAPPWANPGLKKKKKRPLKEKGRGGISEKKKGIQSQKGNPKEGGEKRVIQGGDSVNGGLMRKLLGKKNLGGKTIKPRL